MIKIYDKRREPFFLMNSIDSVSDCNFVVSIISYYMAGSVSGQDEANPVL